MHLFSFRKGIPNFLLHGVIKKTNNLMTRTQNTTTLKIKRRSMKISINSAATQIRKNAKLNDAKRGIGVHFFYCVDLLYQLFIYCTFFYHRKMR